MELDTSKDYTQDMINDMLNTMLKNTFSDMLTNTEEDMFFNLYFKNDLYLLTLRIRRDRNIKNIALMLTSFFKKDIHATLFYLLMLFNGEDVNLRYKDMCFSFFVKDKDESALLTLANDC